ncbi:uncharacterized protein LOC130813382 [Amaranthus tricolor]|uniref:uncharacterized protein LOC130813382 n=1 Tax=Amaranthus tricolor TaxID=29722 RepID=UPI002588D96D|nr:uncharacterized protein LOC130813382 [Amaranthus tricolor]
MTDGYGMPFFGMSGSYNDLNVLYRPPLLVDLFEGRAPPSITEPQTPKAMLFAQHQEATRKDVERAFGVLRARFAIIRKPSLAWDEERLSNIITSCIIMHNMIVKDERDTYTHYANDRIVDINRYLANKDDVEDRQTNLSLKR